MASCRRNPLGSKGLPLDLPEVCLNQESLADRVERLQKWANRQPRGLRDFHHGLLVRDQIVR